MVNPRIVKSGVRHIRVTVAAKPSQERFRNFVDLLLVGFDVDFVGFQEWNEFLLEFVEGVACCVNVWGDVEMGLGVVAVERSFDGVNRFRGRWGCCC